MRLRLRLATIFLVTWSSVGVGVASETSNDAGPSGDESFMSAYGFAEHDSFDAKPSLVTLDLNQEKAIEHLKEMRALKLLNEDTTEETAKKKPNLFAVALLIQYSIISIKLDYDNNPKLDRVHVVTNSVMEDEFGNDQTHQIMSFDFTRAIYKKINWDKFQPAYLAKVSSSFRFSPWFLDHFSQEKDAAD